MILSQAYFISPPLVRKAIRSRYIFDHVLQRRKLGLIVFKYLLLQTMQWIREELRLGGRQLSCRNHFLTMRCTVRLYKPANKQTAENLYCSLSIHLSIHLCSHKRDWQVFLHLKKSLMNMELFLCQHVQRYLTLYHPYGHPLYTLLWLSRLLLMDILVEYRYLQW